LSLALVDLPMVALEVALQHSEKLLLVAVAVQIISMQPGMALMVVLAVAHRCMELVALPLLDLRLLALVMLVALVVQA
jgi:hypothetical protein